MWLLHESDATKLSRPAPRRVMCAVAMYVVGLRWKARCLDSSVERDL